jgi:ceramide glucosyltransferase
MTPILAWLSNAAAGWRVLLALALLGSVSSTVFLGMVTVAALRYRRTSRTARAAALSTETTSLPLVSLLKPLHGMEPRLEENLASFFQQDYPNFEVILGARDADNAALQVARRVCARFPGVKSRVVLSGFPTWPNAKVYSLNRMIAETSSNYVVISDSDIKVAPDFLRNVVPALLDPKVGLVTCPYRGIPAGDFGSLLEGLGMSVEMPSGVIVADMLEGMRFAMGAVMATRRDVLEKIGGFAELADYYSDDFVLGHKVWTAGYEVVLSHYVVGHVLMPQPFSKTVGDQLRWMKSTRYSRPKGHIGTGLTFAVPFGILGVVSGFALGQPRWGIYLLAATLLNRMLQAFIVGWGVIGDRRALAYCWLYPVRDLLGFLTWAGSFTGRSFRWRGETYDFGEDGKITPQHRRVERPVADRV